MSTSTDEEPRPGDRDPDGGDIGTVDRLDPGDDGAGGASTPEPATVGGHAKPHVHPDRRTRAVEWGGQSFVYGDYCTLDDADADTIPYPLADPYAGTSAAAADTRPEPTAGATPYPLTITVTNAHGESRTFTVEDAYTYANALRFTLAHLDPDDLTRPDYDTLRDVLANAHPDADCDAFAHTVAYAESDARTHTDVQSGWTAVWIPETDEDP